MRWSRWRTLPSLHPEPPTLSSTGRLFNRPMPFPILALARRTHFSAPKIEWQPTSETSAGTQLEPWTESELKTLPKDLGLQLLRSSGQPVSSLLILCTVLTVCNDEDLLDQVVCRRLCTGRCRGQKVEGSSGVFRSSQRGSVSLYPKNPRTAVTMTWMRMRMNGYVYIRHSTQVLD